MKYLDKYKDDFNKCIEYMKNIKSWYKLIPNLLTISRPIGMIPVNILFFTGNIIPALILTSGLLITDFFDGKLARKWNVQSKLGADLDAVGDKIMFLGLVLPLLLNYPVLFINLLGEGFIAAVNVRGRINGLDMKTVFLGKVKTWFLSITLGIGYLVHFFNIPVNILKGVAIITGLSQCMALQEYVYIYNKLKEQKEDNYIENEIESNNCNNDKEEKLLEQLKREREFIVSTLEHGRVYTGKKRVRVMIQERNNI